MNKIITMLLGIMMDIDQRIFKNLRMKFDEIERIFRSKVTDVRIRELAKANRGNSNEKNVIASCFWAKREADIFMMDGRRPLKLQLLLPLPPSVRSLQLLLAAGNAELTPILRNPSELILFHRLFLNVVR